MAREESVDTILECSNLKKQGAIDRLIVMGCFSERYGDDLEREIPEVDKFFGTANHADILTYLTGKEFKKSEYAKPLIAVPSSYSKTYEKDLIKHGFKIVIYANHLLRAAYPAMLNAARTILANQRSYDVEKKISSIKEVINLI